MDYQEIALRFESDLFPEILEAELAEIGFDSFTSNRDTLKAYIPASEFDPDLLEAILTAYREIIISKEIQQIDHQNWNELWESNYDPVTVDDKIFIGAPFHQVPDGFENNIILEPNMSFGTGHHPTTHMMLRTLSTMDIMGKSLFDFGAGSGILCIYADQRGANGFGVEIDEHAAQAANENLNLNKCESFHIVAGGIEEAAERKVDIIVANINRNVIEESANKLRAIIEDGGTLLCAGFLNSDTPALTSFLEANRFEKSGELSDGEWTLLKFIAS